MDQVMEFIVKLLRTDDFPARWHCGNWSPFLGWLYVSSDAKDTDFTVKLIDVYPDGRAYNLDETIQRVRYREGYDRPETRMEPGKTYKVALQPMTTSNFFAAGHRVRVEVSSSNFPRFDRNPNTGRAIADETELRVAHQTVYYGVRQSSHLLLPVIP